MPHSTVMTPEETALLVIDMQEKLVPKIHEAASVVRNTAFLIDAARLLGVDVLATEQYPKGLGPTIADLRQRLPGPVPEKLAFSSCAVKGLVEDLRAKNRFRIVLAGIEAHVCVLHTALDLIAEDLWVYVPVDAVSSRSSLDREWALRRLESAGAVLVTSEMAVFEWLGGAHHPRFKDVSALIQQRMKAT
jgi:nicotinamidase-related amidase